MYSLNFLRSSGQSFHSSISGSIAAFSITLVPVLMLLFIRGRIPPENKNPIVRFLIWVYRPIIHWVMGWKKLTIAAIAIPNERHDA